MGHMHIIPTLNTFSELNMLHFKFVNHGLLVEFQVEFFGNFLCPAWKSSTSLQVFPKPANNYIPAQQSVHNNTIKFWMQTTDN